MPKISRTTTKTTKTKLPTVKTKTAQGINDYILLFYGPPGVGKTTFVNGLAERVLIISTDRGARFLESLAVEVNNLRELDSVLDQLVEKPGQYDMICLDHIDDVCVMAEEESCAELGVESLSEAEWGTGWKRMRGKLQKIVAKMKASGCGVVFVAHETIKTVRTRAVDTERTMPEMPKGAWKTIVPLCDLVGFCGFTHIKVGGKRKQIRIVDTEPREDLYAKDRTTRNRPANYDPLNGEKFAATFTTDGNQETSKQKGVRKKVTRKAKSAKRRGTTRKSR